MRPKVKIFGDWFTFLFLLVFPLVFGIPFLKAGLEIEDGKDRGLPLFFGIVCLGIAVLMVVIKVIKIVKAFKRRNGEQTYGVIRAIVKSPIIQNNREQFQYTIAYIANGEMHWKQMIGYDCGAYDGKPVYVAAAMDNPKNCEVFLQANMSESDAMECGNLHSELYTAPIPDEIDTSNLVRRGSIAFSAVFLIVGLIVLVIGFVLSELFMILFGLLFAAVGTLMIIKEVTTQR